MITRAIKVLFKFVQLLTIILMINSKKIVEKLKGEADRSSKTLFLSQSVFAEFESYCGDLAPSREVEECLRQFIEDAKKKGLRPTKKNIKKN